MTTDIDRSVCAVDEAIDIAAASLSQFLSVPHVEVISVSSAEEVLPHAGSASPLLAVLPETMWSHYAPILQDAGLFANGPSTLQIVFQRQSEPKIFKNVLTYCSDTRNCSFHPCLLGGGGATRATLGELVVGVPGRARALLHGPYITLPAGRWILQFDVTFDEDAASYGYRVEWGGTASYNSLELHVPSEGRYNVRISHDADGVEPLELRVIVTEGSLAGELRISKVSITSQETDLRG